MLVAKLMRPNPITVSPQDSFRCAAALIRQRGIRQLPVVERGRLVGMVTDRDLRRASPAAAPETQASAPPPERLTVRELMTPRVITVAPDTPLEEATRLLLAHRIGALPVVRGEALIGLLTEADILRALVEIPRKRGEASRLELLLKEQPGAFLEVCRIVREQGGDIVGVLGATATHHGVEKQVVVLRLEGIDMEALVRDLEATGHTVLSATV